MTTMNRNRPIDYECNDHVHEITGSTSFVEERCEEPHNHRFATVSTNMIRTGNSHVHEVEFKTDTHENHEHEFCGRTSTSIAVGQNRHTHFLQGRTTRNEGHTHEFRTTTLIENPTRRSITREYDERDRRY